MDLSALGGLRRRVAPPVVEAPIVETVEPEPTPVTVSSEPPVAQQEVAVEASVPQEATNSPEPTADATTTPAVATEAPQPATTTVADAEPAAAVQATAPVVEPVVEDHSGHVTLYLPKELNEWLGKAHANSGVSYPGLVLNAISWAASESKLAEIFAPEDSPIPSNDIFGRAPTIAKPVRGSIEPATRPLRFRKDHMQVIIGLARTWTADNRNAFFVGVLSAYRDQQSSELPAQ